MNDDLLETLAKYRVPKFYSGEFAGSEYEADFNDIGDLEDLGLIYTLAFEDEDGAGHFVDMIQVRATEAGEAELSRADALEDERYLEDALF
jgi:hypothetical protein